MAIILICVTIKNVNKKANRRSGSKSNRLQNEQPNFHEVDAFGDDFVDFGAMTGDLGAFSWHADFPIDN